MKKLGIIITFIAVALFAVGCGKKTEDFTFSHFRHTDFRFLAVITDKHPPFVKLWKTFRRYKNIF